MCNARLATDRRRSICRVFLDDSAKIKTHLHTGKTQARAAPPDVLPAHARTRGGDLNRRRHVRALRIPQLGQRTRRDIELARALAKQRVGEVEQVCGLVIDVDVVCGCINANPREKIVVAIVRVLFIEPRDFGNRRLRGSACCGDVIRFELDFARAAHARERKAE